MSQQEFNTKSEASGGQPHPSIVLRVAGFILFALLPFFLGPIPFVMGVASQALSPRRIPPYVIGPLAAALFFAIRLFTDWLPVTVGEGGPAWPSVALSLLLFIVCFSVGAALLRELLPHRFSTPAASPIPQ